MKKILSVVFPLAALAVIVYFCFLWQPKLTETQSSQVIMGSVVTVKTYTDTADKGKAKQDAAFDSIKALDSLISKNTEGAELYRLNTLSGKENIIGAELFGYINETKNIYSSTSGRLSVTSGALTESWGMDTDDFRVPSEEEISTALPLCDDSTLILDKERLSVKTAEGQILNLGSVGKGIACDKAREALELYGEERAVVSVGGSVGLFGVESSNLLHKSKGWVVGIRDPYGNENDYFAKLNFNNLEFKGGPAIFISTSGSYEKTFEVDGKTYHHILDLTTGYPVKTELVSVTVKADTGMLSDALSTLCFVMGEEASREILEKYGADAVFVYSDKSVSVTDGLRDALEIVNGDYYLR